MADLKTFVMPKIKVWNEKRDAHPECVARFKSFCSAEAEIMHHDAVGLICVKCLKSLELSVNERLSKPPTAVKPWREISTGSSEFSRKKYGSGGFAKTLNRKERKDKKNDET